MSEWRVVADLEFTTSDGITVEGERSFLVSPSDVIVAEGRRTEWLRDIARILNGYKPKDPGTPEKLNPAFVKEAERGQTDADTSGDVGSDPH